MYLSKITVQDFKNIGEAQLDFSPKINCITGNNGAGKTNMLDAVYYLSMTKSFFSSSDQFVYRHDTSGAVVSGLYQMDDGTSERVAVSIRKGGAKSLQRNGKQYERFSDHIGLFPIVMVSPMDSSLINDSGEERRKYMNFILSQTDREYLRHIQQYSRLLLRRNKILKELEVQDVLLETVSEQMEPHARYVYEARRNLCEKILPIMQDYYAKLSGGAEEVSMEYSSDLADENLLTLFDKDSQRDRLLRFTSSGVQRDDVNFSLCGYPLRKCGSQGQQKSFLLAMKLAQFSFMRDLYSLNPILLLDDVFDKLDMERVQHLLSLVARNDFGQIFITDSNKVRIDRIVDAFRADCANFSVEAGQYKRI